MFDINRQPEFYLVDVWYQSSAGWLLVDDWYAYTLGIWLFSLHFRVCKFQKRYLQFWHLFDCTLSFLLVLKNICGQTSGWCLISNVNQNCIWMIFYINRQPELYLVDVWYQSPTGWLLVDDWYSQPLCMFSMHFRVCRFQKRYAILTPFWLHFVGFACIKTHLW